MTMNRNEQAAANVHSEDKILEDAVELGAFFYVHILYKATPEDRAEYIAQAKQASQDCVDFTPSNGRFNEELERVYDRVVQKLQIGIKVNTKTLSNLFNTRIRTDVEKLFKDCFNEIYETDLDDTEFRMSVYETINSIQSQWADVIPRYSEFGLNVDIYNAYERLADMTKEMRKLMKDLDQQLKTGQDFMNEQKERVKDTLRNPYLTRFYKKRAL